MKNLKQEFFAYRRQFRELKNSIRRRMTPLAAPQWHYYIEKPAANDSGLDAIAAARRIIVSQHGEDGILLYLIDKLKLTAKTCLEVGAWDGKHLSNTWNLIENHDWTGVLIELSAKRFQDLPKAYSNPSKNIYINACASFSGPNTLDNLLQTHGFKGTMDIMSIDIDSDDWHIFNSINVFKPNIVVIEYNRSIPNHVYFVQAPNSKHPAGASLAAFVELGRQKGYEPVFVTETNVILVKSELYPLLGIASNKLDDLRPITLNQNAVFHGYDGTVYVTGHKMKFWQRHVPVAGHAAVYLDEQSD